MKNVRLQVETEVSKIKPVFPSEKWRFKGYIDVSK